jgi:uncharacterized protein YdhG (YjbR/CyaY superfamily)
MAEKKTTKKSTKTAAKRTTAPRNSSSKFTADERAAMKERAKELKAEAARADGEEALRAAIAKMKGKDRTMAERVHAIVTASAPELSPKTWYGMPAYAKDGEVLCFYQDAGKFKTRYATFGFTDAAKLDQGDLWPVTFALKELSAAEEKKLGALLKKAVR